MKGLASALRCALAACVVLPAVRAELTPAQAAKCKALTTCFLGGVKTNPCTISDGNCAACVDFSANSCFAKEGDKCHFDTWVDCTGAFNDGSSTTPPSGGSSSGAGHSTAPSAGSNDRLKRGSSSGSHHKNAGEAGSQGSGSSSSMVFVIIGVTCGVIAVAVIFLVLIRRSRTPRDDEADEMEVTPVGMAKAPQSFVQDTPAYAPYSSQPTPAHPIPNPTTPTNRVVQYYKDNAMPSPRVSSRGFGVAQPALEAPKVVRTAPSANAPTFFGPSSGVIPNEPMYASAQMQMQMQQPMAEPQYAQAQPAPMTMNEMGYAPSSSAVHVGAPAPAPRESYGVPAEERRTGVMMQMHAEEVEVPDEQAEAEGPDNEMYAPGREHHDSFEF